MKRFTEETVPIPDTDEPLKTAPPGAPVEMSFAVLGQRMGDVEDEDLDYQTRREANFSARKACAMLKVTSAIVNAVVVYPGGDCDESELSETTRTLMRRSADLADASIELLDIRPDHPGFAGYRNLLRQQAAEVVATQWRMANSTGKVSLSVEQITEMFKVVLDHGEIEKEGELPAYPSDVDPTTAKRLAVLGVVPDIFSAVNSFNYFAPNPETLVEKGVKAVLKSSQAGVRRLASRRAGPGAVTMVTQSLINKAGALYAANYRAQARRAVLALQKMDSLERRRHIYVHREAGLPTDHVDQSFERLMSRMVEMVCEAVPELSADHEQEAESTPGGVQQNPTLTGETRSEFKPE